MTQARKVALFSALGALVLALSALGVFFLLRERDPVLKLSAQAGAVRVSFGDTSVLLNEGEEKTMRVPVGEEVILTRSREGVFSVNGIDASRERTVKFEMQEGGMHVSLCKRDSFDPLLPSVKVYEAPEVGQNAYRPFFPSVTQAEDGTILVVFYLSDGHALYNQSEGKLSGKLMLTSSVDGAKTWSTPKVLVDLTDEDRAAGDFNREARDPNLQRLSDGTLLLTFPVRAPIGKAGMNGANPNDYWSERTYYMTSVDHGKTWSEMREIECDYFSGGKPFLYDDKTRTTGTWVKNGSVAELADGDLLIPLYGAPDCSTRAIYQSVVVRAKNNGDGTLTFQKDWAKNENGQQTDASPITKIGAGNETALVAHGNTVYALVRTSIPSATKGGEVLRSVDGGLTWEFHALEPTANDCLNQPNFSSIGGEMVLVNYSVPLASVYGSPARRTARPVYGKLFDLQTGDWDAYEAVTVYDVQSAAVADMANPASVLLSDGRIMTVYYDTSAPTAKRGFIGATFTVLSDYLSDTNDLNDLLRRCFAK